MPHDNKKIYMPLKSTGTIPKVKQRNNNNAGASGERRSNLVSNNLGNQNLHFYHMMDVNQENGPQNGIFSSNGTLTSNESNTISRRNSSGLSKCDNVKKYPDKKQIESKLGQIQEYLHAATSMKANMKKTDEQIQSITMCSSHNLTDEPMDGKQLDAIIKDLADSEVKLQMILDDIDGTKRCNQFLDGAEHLDPEVIRQNKNELERKVDVATRDLQMLKEQENYLLHLQLNAENKLREARLAQVKLAKSSQSTRNTNSEAEWCNDSDTLSMSGASSGRNLDFRELEERIKSFNIDDTKLPMPEQFQGQIDHLQNHIQQMRESNDNRTQLIHILDSRDAQLQAQHTTLQGKLQELQNKKNQVDQLVVQLQTMNEESEEDEIGCHVKKIVNMKEQLTKLKDMLNLVQNTEDSMGGYEQNDGINAEIEENVNGLIAKTDNLMQQNRVPHVDNIENAPLRSNYPPSSNERRVKEKQVNKKSMNANEKERMKLQAELRAKRKELEELMCKHKAANSNLNHDTHSKKHSDIAACSNMHMENAPNAWCPMDSNIFNAHIEQPSSESDDGADEDLNEFSEMNSSGELNSTTVQPMPAFSYPTTNYIRMRPSQEAPSPRAEMPHDSLGTLSSRSPARSVRSATPAFPPRENAPSRSQIQKQLELIKTVCDSMLESSQEDTEQTAPVRVRNNLTPSPIYTEPRHFSPRPNLPTASSANALNVVNYPEPPISTQVPPHISAHDTTAYNSWLTTNSLQTQAFILNTLNQCCQMLWHQQKELSALRNAVGVLQDRVGSGYHDESTPLCMQSNPCIYQPNLPNVSPHASNYVPNNYRHPMASKMNQSSLNPNPSAGSMPNLNGHCAHLPTSHATNMEHAAFCNNMMPNNAAALQQHQNVVGDHQLHTNHIMLPNQTASAPIWNGQALNNQVAPGNRANNYWDNFRSYSRQNLFSTKSNDGTQNLFNERSNQSSERHRSVNQDVVSTSSASAKSNSNHNEALAASGAASGTSASVENSPRRISVPKRRVATSSREGNSPSQSSDRSRTPERQGRQKAANKEAGVGAAASATAFTLPRIDSEFASAQNEWPSENSIAQRTKLFEDLRENVYKEVASLISANEERPHFLIQLFQDLQLVSSDPLRRNVLQSVQALITSSLTSSNIERASSSRQHQSDAAPPRQNEKYAIHEESSADYELLTMQRDASATTSDGNMSDIAADAQTDVQRPTQMWPIISKHSVAMIADQENQEQFHEALSSFLNIRQEDDAAYIEIAGEPSKFMMPFASGEEEIPRLHILVQNGDLAEADQSCAADEDDEGAVGGLLNILERSSSSNAGQIHLDEETIMETEDESEQGLDQVPTRLSNPPSIGCSPKSQ